MRLYRRLLRPALFRLSGDTAHELSMFFFRSGLSTLFHRASVDDERLSTDLAGIRLRNPVGLAAGFDKDCGMVRGLAALGFGYLVVGSIMSRPRRGNERPRVVRRVKDLGLVNSMGLPSLGAERCAQNLRRTKPSPAPVLGSVGGFSVEEYIRCLRIVEPLVDGVELNVSCPNVEGGGEFQDPYPFEKLAAGLEGVRAKPLFVKVSPYLDEEEREQRMEVVATAMRRGMEGVTAINTRKVAEPRLATGSGGLSGKPLFEHMLRAVSEIYGETSGRMQINACGGVFAGGDAFKAISAGATTVQLYTALVYEGPGAVKRIKAELLDLLLEKGFSTVSELRGYSSS